MINREMRKAFEVQIVSRFKYDETFDFSEDGATVYDDNSKHFFECVNGKWGWIGSKEF